MLLSPSRRRQPVPKVSMFSCSSLSSSRSHENRKQSMDLNNQQMNTPGNQQWKIRTDISSSSSSRLPASPSVGISPSDRQNSDVELSSMDVPYCAGASTSSVRATTTSRSLCRRMDLLCLSRRALLKASSSSSAAVSSSTTTPVRSSSGPSMSSEHNNNRFTDNLGKPVH